MIILTEVAKKLEKILNGLDSETSEITNPLNGTYYFKVQTEGFHIDSVAREDNSGNFIPVFISSMGGQFNPVKGLKQGTYTIPIAFYYPVRFKDDFFLLGDFLVEAFVGNVLNYGEISGKAVSNISVPQYGEIQNLDLVEFKKWVDANYDKKIEVMEPYLSMQVVLYLTNAADGLLYGNDIKIDFTFTHNGTSYTLQDIDWDGASLQSNSQQQSEQVEGDSESSSLPFGTAYGSSLKIYPNLNTKAVGSNNKFYRAFLKLWVDGKIQDVECNLSLKIGNDAGLVFNRRCYIQSVVAPIEKGQLFALTLTFAKKTQYDLE